MMATRTIYITDCDKCKAEITKKGETYYKIQRRKKGTLKPVSLLTLCNDCFMNRL